MNRLRVPSPPAHARMEGEVHDWKVLAEAKGESLGSGSEAYILEAH